MNSNNRLVRLAVDNIPLLTTIAIYLIFSLWSDRFLQIPTIQNIARQASYIGIVGVGVTFALIAGGIDLSVGSIIYLSLAVAGTLGTMAALPDWSVVIIILATGTIAGALNGLAVVGLGLSPFVTTLATLSVYRGVGLLLTQSTQIHIPNGLFFIGRAKLLGIPVPVIIFLAVALLAALVMHQTAFGRRLYAVGINPDGAQKAGISVGMVRFVAQTISGLCASLGGLVLATQFGVVNANDGRGVEFDAIAVVVLGGISLYGGRGTVFPGVVVGAILVQVVNAGLIFARTNIYIQPIVFSLIIFVAVLLDGQRGRLLNMLSRKLARPASPG